MALKILITFLLTLVFLSLGGCASMHPAKVVYVKRVNDPSMLRLNQVAEKAEQSQMLLAEIQTAVSNSSVTLQGAQAAQLSMTAIPSGWGKKTSVEFVGPFNKLVQNLATGAGYEYFTQGPRPANVPLVTIDAKQQSLKQILNQVVSQLPREMSVTLYPRTHALIVNYHER